MKVILIYDVHHGGPITGRKVYDPWPFDSIPRTHDSIQVGAEMLYIEHLIWDPDGEYVEIHDRWMQPMFGNTPAERKQAAARKITEMRAVGFDFGPERDWETEALA